LRLARAIEKERESSFVIFANRGLKREHLIVFAVKLRKTEKIVIRTKKLCILKTDIPMTYKKE